MTCIATIKNIDSNFSYQWLLNGSPAGKDTSVFSTSAIGDGDSIRCLLKLTDPCILQTYSSNGLIIKVDPGLVPSVSISTPADTICKGAATDFFANGVNAGYVPSYQWMVNGKPVGPDSVIFHTASLVNGDIISCALTRYNACTIDSIAGSNTIVMFVRQVVAPQISIISSGDTACSGNPVHFVAAETGSVTPVYQWEINGNKTGENSAMFTSVTLQNGDEVTCTLTAPGSGCASDIITSNIITETIYPTPAIITTGDTIITKGMFTNLTAKATGNVSSYQWSPPTALSNAEIADPVATPPESIVYRVAVSSDQGCNSEKSVHITVIPKINIPTAFTPNKDGKNEYFEAIYGSDITEVHLKVFNRWGQLLFEDPGSHQKWDGSYGGVLQPAGTYVWVFLYRDSNGLAKTLSGTLVLIK